MDKVVRRAIFSKDKRIYGYFYFMGKSPFDHYGNKGCVLGIMRELLYEDNIKDGKNVFARLGEKDLVDNAFRVLSKENTIMDISDILIDERYKLVISDGYKTMVYVETVDDVESYSNVDYYRCGINNDYFDDIVSEIKRRNKKLVICGINNESLYGKAEKYNPDCYEGSAVAPYLAQIGMGDLFLSSTIDKISSLLDNKEYNLENMIKVVRTDVKVASTLIRFANTLEFTENRHKSRTITDSIIALGKDKLKYIVDTTNQGKTNDVRFENEIKLSLFRAEFCVGLNNVVRNSFLSNSKNNKLISEDAYMIGLFSDLDIVSHKSMKDALKNLGQSEDIEDALIYKEGTGGTILKLALAYDEGKQDKISKYSISLGLKKENVDRIYTNSICITNQIWSMVHM